RSDSSRRRKSLLETKSHRRRAAPTSRWQTAPSKDAQAIPPADGDIPAEVPLESTGTAQASPVCPSQLQKFAAASLGRHKYISITPDSPLIFPSPYVTRMGT